MEAICFLSTCLLFNWVSGLVRKKHSAPPSLRALPQEPAGDPFPPEAEGHWYSFEAPAAFLEEQA